MNWIDIIDLTTDTYRIQNTDTHTQDNNRDFDADSEFICQIKNIYDKYEKRERDRQTTERKANKSFKWHCWTNTNKMHITQMEKKTYWDIVTLFSECRRNKRLYEQKL